MDQWKSVASLAVMNLGLLLVGFALIHRLILTVRQGDVQTNVSSLLAHEFEGRTRLYLREYMGYSAQFKDPFITLLSFYFTEFSHIAFTCRGLDRKSTQEQLSIQKAIANEVLTECKHEVTAEGDWAGLAVFGLKSVQVAHYRSSVSGVVAQMHPILREAEIAKKITRIPKLTHRVSRSKRQQIFEAASGPTRLVLSAMGASGGVVFKCSNLEESSNILKFSAIYDDLIAFDASNELGGDPFQSFVNGIIGSHLEYSIYVLAFARDHIEDEFVIFATARLNVDSHSELRNFGSNYCEEDQKPAVFDYQKLKSNISRGRVSARTAILCGLLDDYHRFKGHTGAPVKPK